MASPDGTGTVRRPSILKGLLAPRVRTWGLIVPIHLTAFTLFYFATDALLQRELLAIASTLARAWLSQAASEIHAVAGMQSPNAETGHDFDTLAGDHRDIGFKLFLPGGAVVGPDVVLTKSEHDDVVELLSGDEIHRFWLSSDDGPNMMRGLQRVVARVDCAPCHQAGETLAVASMTLDLSDQIERVSVRSRQNLLLLIVAWLGAVAVTSAMVNRSVRKAAARLEDELAAAEAGAAAPPPASGDLVLDPAAAELQKSVLHFLRRQRRREAEVASRLAHTDQLASVGQLAAGLAHEIKNPLAGIQSALEILRQDLPQPTDRDLCTEMLGELERVNDTLQSLLTSARPSPPQRRPTDLARLVDEINRLMAPGLRQRGIAFEIDVAAGPLEASVDPAKIRQVLLNLVNNAADALGKGGRIVLRAGPMPEGDGVILAVEDDGPGIPKDQEAKIFDPFFTTKFSGTGLGLSIASSLVEQHGGSLQFETEPDVGTTFYVLLPTDAASGTAASDTTQADAERGLSGE